MTTGEAIQDRPGFSEDRVDNVTILQELHNATALSEDELREQIPELNRTDLAFGGMWADEGYDSSEVGRYNAQAVRDFVVLHIPSLSVDGTAECNVDGINRSYAINAATGAVTGAEDFYGAGRYLREHFATARKSTDEVTAHLGRQAVPPPEVS